MHEENEIRINIPCDADGYLLLRCERCGEFFKLKPSDIEDEGTIWIFCPCCGLTSENYFTSDVIELALTASRNYAYDYIYDAFKGLEKKTKNGIIRFKAGNKPRHEEERPIKSIIDAFEIISFACCKRSAKTRPGFKFTGGYCPFCGVKNYEIE